jgi:succinylglutamic semialdehyde dehydrogenase
LDHEGIDGVMFTGSTDVGRAILSQSARWPGRLLALELGGKNPALVLDDADLAYTAAEIAFSAYVTAGQRCTATSRVIAQRSVVDALAERLAQIALRAGIGPPDAPATLLGPVISEAARDRALTAVARSHGRYESLVSARIPDTGDVRGYYLAPSLYRLRPGVGSAPDALESEELFAPVLTLEVVDSEEDGVLRCNASRYGLAASVYTAERARFERLAPEIDAGVCNWNRGTVGSSSRLPFGGVKDSGNHRPAGLFSAYYCVDPVAELQVERPSLGPPVPGLVLPDT